MAVSTEFQEAVEAGNILGVRIMLSNYILKDPSFHEFYESLDYARPSMPDLIEPHDGEKLNYDRSTWNKDALDDAMAALMDNFSQERIDLIRNMCGVIYGEQVEERNREEFIKAAQAGQAEGVSRKQVGTAVAGAGAVAVLGGVLLSSTQLTIAGAVGVAVGAYLIFSDDD